MGAGRPTDYSPEICDQVVAWGKSGKSKAWMCAELDICPQTMANWEAAHPEFMGALTRAMAHSQKWWEDAGQNGLTADKFQGNVWSRSMAARFPRDWRESKDMNLGGQPNNPLKVTAIQLIGPDDNPQD